jgi:hypothetical protein
MYKISPRPLKKAETIPDRMHRMHRMHNIHGVCRVRAGHLLVTTIYRCQHTDGDPDLQDLLGPRFVVYRKSLMVLRLDSEVCKINYRCPRFAEWCTRYMNGWIHGYSAGGEEMEDDEEHRRVSKDTGR